MSLNLTKSTQADCRWVRKAAPWEKRKTNRRGSARAASSRCGARAQVAAKPSDLVSSKVIRLANILRRSSTLVYGRRFGLSQVEWRIVALVGNMRPIAQRLSDLMGLDKGQRRAA